MHNSIPKFQTHCNLLIALLFLCCAATNLSSQVQLDSLKSVWHDEAQTDSVRTKAYANYIQKGFLYSNPDSAFVLTKNLEKFGRDRNYLKAQHSAFMIQGIIYMRKGEYSAAIASQEKALELQQKENDTHAIAGTLHGMAVIYRRQGSRKSA